MLSGAPSMSRLLTMLAQEPRHFEEMLRPDFERLLEKNKDLIRRRHKVTIKIVVDRIQSGEMTPTEIEEAFASIKARKLAEAKMQMAVTTTGLLNWHLTSVSWLEDIPQRT